MRKEDIKNYIGQLLNTLETKAEESEIPNAILLLAVYMAGLEKKPFPLDKIGNEHALKIEQEVPEQFHTLVAQLAIKKSRIEERINEPLVIEYLMRNMLYLLREFRNYFLTS